MKEAFVQLTQENTIKVEFRHIAPYSPKLNIVEYAIHLIRQQITHHADFKTSLENFEHYIKELCIVKILSKTQIINVLQHIDSIVIEN